jgi:hypothetical protein
MYVCRCVCMYVFACMCLHLQRLIFVCTHVFMYVCVCVYVPSLTKTDQHKTCADIHMYMHVSVYVDDISCIYIDIHACTYTHTYTHTSFLARTYGNGSPLKIASTSVSHTFRPPRSRLNTVCSRMCIISMKAAD